MDIHKPKEIVLKLLLNGPRGNEVILYGGELSLPLINAHIQLCGRDGNESQLVAILPEKIRVGKGFAVCGFIVNTVQGVINGSITTDMNLEAELPTEALVTQLISILKKSYQCHDARILGLQII